MNFKAWQKTSLIEFPGKLSTVLFTGGCNFRCPFCYNASLVLAPEAIPDLPGDTAIAYLRSRRRLYQAAVVTGGEPTLHEELPAFLETLKSMGFLTGLETNGSRPKLLARLIAEGLLDFVALDVKGPLDGRSYRKAAAPTEDVGRIVEAVRESLGLLAAAAGPIVEVRCTVVPGLHGPGSLRKLGKQLSEGGLRRLVLQQFRPQAALDPALRELQPYSGEMLANQRRRFESLGLECGLRGV